MSRVGLLLVLAALLLTACGAAVGEDQPPGEDAIPARVTSTTVVMPPSSTAPPPTTPPAPACLNPDETPYRSRWSEISDDFVTEVRREIHGRTGQWVFEDVEGDLSGRPRSTVVVDDVAWQLEQDGTWREMPIVPLRFPLLVWVNGYVTGEGVARAFEAGSESHVAGIPVTEYQGGIEEMTRAFPGKMRGREFEPSTTFTYWVDDCGTLLKADVSVELGGEERAIAVDIDLPTTYRYEYEVYDVGAAFDIRAPRPGFLPEIPGP